jgi:hypothetical protein
MAFDPKTNKIFLAAAEYTEAPAAAGENGPRRPADRPKRPSIQRFAPEDAHQVLAEFVRCICAWNAQERSGEEEEAERSHLAIVTQQSCVENLLTFRSMMRSLELIRF